MAKEKIGLVHIVEKGSGASAGTPFLRRWFGNEAAREERETRELYNALAAQPNPYTPIELGARVYAEYASLIDGDVRDLFNTVLNEIICGESYMFECPLPPPSMTLAEFTGYRNFLRSRQYFLANHETVAQHLIEALTRIFATLAERLPKTEAPTPFTIPLVYALPEPKLMIDKTYGTLVEQQYIDRRLFTALTDRLYENLCRISGREPREESKKPWKYASENDLALDETCDRYLAGTSLLDLFKAPIPLKFGYEDRFNHMHVVGGTGAGKTTLLENLILHDLAFGSAGLVIIDSQGDLIRKLTHLAVFDAQLADRFVYISPKDIDHPPALNVFDVSQTRLKRYDAATKEQVIAGVIQTFDYLFAGLLGADLTAKQGVFFRYVARLMLALPEAMGRNATILDMLHLLENPEPYRAAIETLPPLQRNFFERDLLDPKNSTFKQTKEQIRYRLHAILENPTIAKLFTSEKTKLDLFEEMNKGSIIFVDTAQDFLKDAHSHFGRIFISLVLQATQERAAIPASDRRPVFLIVDEAADYFDTNIDDLLTDARKYKVGCLFAHQYLDQATPALKASLAANASIKFASGVSASDARYLAGDMRTTQEFILNQPKLQFAAHIRNVTPEAVSIPVVPGLVERIEQLSDDGYRRMMERNRERVSFGPARPALPLPTSEPDYGTKTAPEW